MRSFGTNRLSGIGCGPGLEPGGWPRHLGSLEGSAVVLYEMLTGPTAQVGDERLAA